MMLCKAARRNAPWTEQKHRRFEMTLRERVFELMTADKTLPWDDMRHVLQAWTVVRLREMIAVEMRQREYQEMVYGYFAEDYDC